MKRACELICVALCLFAAEAFGDVSSPGAAMTNENMGVAGALVTTNTLSHQCCSDDGFDEESVKKSSDRVFFENYSDETNGYAAVLLEIPQEKLADVDIFMLARSSSNLKGAVESAHISGVYKDSESESLAFAEYVNELMTYRGAADDSVVISFNPEGLFTRHSDGAKFGAVSMLFSIKYEF